MGRHGVRDPETRFWANVKLMSDGCLLWTGAGHPNMTGQFNALSTNSTAHRWAWFFEYGTMPDRSAALKHTCKNNWCVNPQHLEQEEDNG